MSRRISRKKILFAIIILAAFAFISVEVFFLSPAVRRQAVGIEESFGMDEALTARLNDSDVDVRGDASDALVRRGEAAAPALIRLLEDPNPDRRTAAANALGRIGPPARAAAPVLKRLMRDESNNVAREQMARALGHVASDQPETIDELIGYLETGDETTRVIAAEALGAVGEPAARAVPALMKALADPSAELRSEAAEALGSMGPAVRPAVPALIAALNDPEEEVRHSVHETLGRLSFELAKTEPLLADQINGTLNQFNARRMTPTKR